MKKMLVWIVSDSWHGKIEKALEKAGMKYEYFVRDYRFKQALTEGLRPDAIFSDGTCRTRDSKGDACDVLTVKFDPREIAPEIPVIGMRFFPITRLRLRQRFCHS